MKRWFKNEDHPACPEHRYHLDPYCPVPNCANGTQQNMVPDYYFPNKDAMKPKIRDFLMRVKLMDKEGNQTGWSWIPARLLAA